MSIILLDWEKAFDKVHRGRLVEVLHRLEEPQNIITLIAKIYARPKFRVKSGNYTSEYMDQSCGIRQGCPLSPYPFIVVMTAMFEDSKENHNLRTSRTKHRVPGALFDEVVYADDTICISETPGQ